MIVPMKKYAFLVHHQNYGVFMDDLKELGVLHIIESKKEPTAAIQEKYRLMADVSKSLYAMKSLAALHPEKVDAANLPTDGETIVARYRELQVELEHVVQQMHAAEKDKKSLQPWGAFEWDTLAKLAEAGLTVRFFSCNVRKYSSEWEVTNTVFTISQLGNVCYFVCITQPNEQLPDWDVDEVRLPSNSLIEAEALLVQLAEKSESLKNTMVALAQHGVVAVETTASQLRDAIASEMAVLHTRNEVNGKVMVLEGWVPETVVASLDAYLESSGVVHLVEPYVEGEKPPVLLKNNRFNRLFEVIGNLYSLPNYSELDLTPYLAPFYLLFFGFCFSDAGYGLLFVIGATIAKIKMQKPNAMLTLVQLLGASTILFGILGGTFFGINLYETGLPIYSSLAVMLKNSDITVQDIMFKASLGLGVIQMLFGMFIKAAKIIKQSSFINAVSTLSWAFLFIFSGVNYYVTSQADTSFWNPVYDVAAGMCLIGIFFLNMPGKNLLLNFGAGLWDAYNTVVGGIGDLLSYVRLFALGLASGILGLVFNDLGVRLITPDASLVMQIVGYFFMVLILVVGHSINIFMSGLGSMVHPLRLTFVEFYKNAGFEGGGKPYNPFRKQTI
jgi:V/A-type H+/Na+-transporting ATPase subunit I